jgi:two-component system sensor histidine kinase YesM
MISRITGTFKTSLKIRMTFYICIMIGVQILLAGLISYRWVFSFIENATISKMQDIDLGIVQEVNYIRKNQEILADRIMANQTIQNNLSARPDPALSPDSFSRNRNDVEFFLWDPENNTHIIIISSSSALYQSQTGEYIFITAEEVQNSPQYRRSLDSEGNSLWFASAEDAMRGNREPCLYLCKTINQTQVPYKPLAQMLIWVPFRLLNAILTRSQSFENEYYLVTDQDNTIIYHTLDQKLIGKNLDTLEESPGRGDRDIIFTANYTSINRGNRWNIIHVVPRAIAASQAAHIRNMVIRIMFILLIISIPLIFWIFNGISKPVISLSKSAEALGADITRRIKVTREDEIGKLQRSFNTIADDIQKLLAETEYSHRELHKLELDTLEYQINPHFLYNSLDSINWMAQKAGNEDIEIMVTALARFFRLGLSRGKEVYRIRDELEHVRQYLFIMKIRYKDTFSFSVDAEEDIMEQEIVKILLQPLAENAVKYGIEKKGKEGIILIRAFRQEGFIHLTVEDNGPGISPAAIARYGNADTNGDGSSDTAGGFGLYNLRKRLQLHYGSAAGIRVGIRDGGGTRAEIYIPCFEG